MFWSTGRITIEERKKRFQRHQAGQIKKPLTGTQSFWVNLGIPVLLVVAVIGGQRLVSISLYNNSLRGNQPERIACQLVEQLQQEDFVEAEALCQNIDKEALTQYWQDTYLYFSLVTAADTNLRDYSVSDWPGNGAGVAFYNRYQPEETTVVVTLKRQWSKWRVIEVTVYGERAMMLQEQR